LPELRKKAQTASFYQGLSVIANAVFALSGLTTEEEPDEDDADAKN